MIGPNEDLKAAILAAIPRDVDDPKFYEKLCVVNEVLLELVLLMQDRYRKDIEELKAKKDEYKHLYEREFASHSCVLGILSDFFPPGADIRECLEAVTKKRR